MKAFVTFLSVDLEVEARGSYLTRKIHITECYWQPESNLVLLVAAPTAPAIKT